MDSLFDLANGANAWRRYYEGLHMSPDEMDAVWLHRLSVPSLESRQLLDEYSSFVSEHFGDDYVNRMKKANSVEKKAEKVADKLERFEVDIASNGSDPQVWLKYLNRLGKLKDGEFRSPLCKATFARIAEISSGPEWKDVWSKYASLDVEYDLAGFYKQMSIKFNDQDSLRKAVELGASLDDECIGLADNATLKLALRHINEVKTGDFGSIFDHGDRDVKRASIFTSKMIDAKLQCYELIKRLVNVDSSEPSTDTDDWIYCLGVAQGYLDTDQVDEMYEALATVVAEMNSALLISMWNVYKVVSGTDETDMDDVRPTKRRKVGVIEQIVEQPVRIQESSVASQLPPDSLSQALEENREIYVTDLPFKATEDEVRSVFATCGEIQMLKLPLRRNNKSSRYHNDGFGYVSYTTPEAATKAINELNGTHLKGREMKVVLAEANKVKRGQNRFDTSKSLSITGITDGPGLEQKLREVGNVTKFERRGRSFCVEFATERESGLASLKLQGAQLGDEHLEISELRRS